MKMCGYLVLNNRSFNVKRAEAKIRMRKKSDLSQEFFRIERKYHHILVIKPK